MQQDPINDEVYLDELYSDSVQSFPEHVDSSKHTMYSEDFLAYVAKTKFSKLQTDLLVLATSEGWPIRVIGVYVGHIEYYLKMEGAHLLERQLRKKEAAIFNVFRPEFLLVQIQESEKLQCKQLWIIAFPSKEYVGHVGELVQAYLDVKHAEYDQLVTIVRHPNCEMKLADWSKIRTGLQQFVRHGDIVVIGNVELIRKQLLRLNYHDRFSGWRKFGLDNMFGVCSMVHQTAHRRVVLLGAMHTYFGSAASLIACAAMQCGARHILYCAKAGTLIHDDCIHTVVVPSAIQVAYMSEVGWQVGKMYRMEVDGDLIFELTKSFGLSRGGIHLTVPTVIGETLQQSAAYATISPTTIDNEDGYIAREVEQFNSEHPKNTVTFLPIHFITDFVNVSVVKERPGASLATGGEEIRRKRDEAFVKISNLVATYVLMHGVVDRLFLPYPDREGDIAGHHRAPNSRQQSEMPLASVTRYIDNGLFDIAIEILLAGRDLHECDSKSIHEIGVVCQKNGLHEDALNCVDILRGRHANTDLMELRCRVLELKVLSQAGDFEGVKYNYPRILDDLEDDADNMERISLKCPVIHRAAIAEAITGNKDKSNLLFAQSLAWTEKYDLPHARASCEMFRCFVDAYYSDSSYLTDTAQQILVGVQDNYLSAKMDRRAWQGNAIRAFSESLLAEAALYLVDRQPAEQRPGYYRLAIFNLLSRFFGGNERSEALSELLACYIKHPQAHHSLRLAMQDDRHGRKAFLGLLADKIGHEVPCAIAEISDIHHWPPSERFRRFREFIEQGDRRYSQGRQ